MIAINFLQKTELSLNIFRLGNTLLLNEVCKRDIDTH
ncbi:unnamed protein product [Ixodes pacificus]